jgi:hypothetical protein
MKHLLAAIAVTFCLAPAQPYDHVVVTSRNLAPVFVPLCSVVENTLGYTDTLVLVEDVCRSFPGRDDPERIRNFIRHAYSNWSTTHVLLGGDIEVVPSRSGYVEFRGRERYIPCDLYYSALDGDWDADADGIFGEPEDSVDFYPDVRIGRMPGTGAGAMGMCVEKFVSYVSRPDADYLDRMFLNAFDIYEWCTGEEATEYYDTALVAESMKPCIKVYDSHGGIHVDSTMRHLNEGQHIWVHVDHSNVTCLGQGWNNHRSVIMDSVLVRIANAPDYTILVSIGCNVGAFDVADCIAEQYCFTQAGGGVATYANTRLAWAVKDDPIHGASFRQIEELLRAWFFTPQDAELGDLADAQARFAPFAAVDTMHRWCHYQFTLFGEPGMPVWIPEQTGVREREEGSGTRLKDSGGSMNQTIVRGLLFWSAATPSLRNVGDIALHSIDGRKVMELRPGENDVRGLAPGVYYIRQGPSGPGSKWSSKKVIISD